MPRRAAALALEEVLAMTKAPPAAALDWVPLTAPPEVETIDVVQRLGALPEGRRHLHHHMILVLVLVDGRDLALAEGVIQGIVDLGGVQAQPRRAWRGRS